MHIFLPQVVENINGSQQAVSLLDRDMSKNRTIYLCGPVTDELAVSVVAQLRYLVEKSTDDITIIIHSPGGSVSAGLMIHDAMKYTTGCDIRTITMSSAASMGAFLLAAGTPGKRYATPNAEIMIHQPSAGTQGNVTDMEINIEHFLAVKQRLNRLLADYTGQTEAQLKADTERDRWLTAQQAVDYGIVDAVYTGEVL